MSPTVQAAIDASIAELAAEGAIVATPREPFGYGTDISCTSDISPTLELVDPTSTLGIAEAILRRLDCPRGALPDDADYGIDLRSYCNRGVTRAEIDTLAGKIRSEVEKDDRIDRAIVRVTSTTSADVESLTVQIVATPADPNLRAFRLVLAVTSAELLLEELAA